MKCAHEDITSALHICGSAEGQHPVGTPNLQLDCYTPALHAISTLLPLRFYCCCCRSVQIQPCSSTVCNYVGYWPAAPTPGSYTNLADVQYSVGNTAIMGNQAGTAIFQVQALSAAVGMINTAAGAIPSGQAVVQDGMAPQAYGFSGAAATCLTCW